MSLSPQHRRGALQSNFDFETHLGWYHGDTVLVFITLPKYSYLKIDSYYEVPLQVLVEAKGCPAKPLMVWQKHQGGLGELRHHIRRRDMIRGIEKLYRTTEKQSEEEDGV